MERLILTPDNAIALNKALENLVRSVFSLQRIALEMTPQQTPGFQEELTDYCRELQRNTRISIQFRASGLENIPSNGGRSGVAYRILQHLLYAAVYTPGMERIRLELNFTAAELVILLSGTPEWTDTMVLETQGGRYWNEMKNLLLRIKGSINWQAGSVLRVNIPWIS